ncbi:hypothetical protein AX17_004519 [Amanita inopinata Kibby_2008]|nr:hypothetical protein AX17_004519 [Amanita inopinata Kibby_2008]
MQSKVFAAIAFTFLAGLASASPVPVNAPLDQIARAVPQQAREIIDVPIAREPSPEPAPEPCRWGCI